MNDMARQMAYGEHRMKDPSVNNASEAVTALKKRAEELRANIARLSTWQEELDIVESMLKAAER